MGINKTDLQLQTAGLTYKGLFAQGVASADLTMLDKLAFRVKTKAGQENFKGIGGTPSVLEFGSERNIKKSKNNTTNYSKSLNGIVLSMVHIITFNQ